MNIKVLIDHRISMGILLIVLLVLPRVVLFVVENHSSPRSLWPDEQGYILIADNLVKEMRLRDIKTR